MSDNDATRKRHRVADPLREYADELSERARYGVTMPNPNVHSGAPIGPTDETCKLYEIADQIDAKYDALSKEFRDRYQMELYDTCIGGFHNDEKFG